MKTTLSVCPGKRGAIRRLALLCLSVTSIASAATTVTLSNIADTSFTAAWTAVSGAAGYQLQVAADDLFTTSGSGGGASASGGGTETFANFSESGSSYNSGTFTGQDGSTWTYGKGRGDQTAPDGTKAITLQRNTTGSFLQSGSITGGVSSLSFQYARPFSENAINLTVMITSDGGSFSTNVTTLPSSTTEVLTFAASNINLTGAFVLCLTNATSNTARVCIDNITWVGYAEGGGGSGSGSVLLDLATNASTLAHSVTGLTAATTYYVRARETDGEWSAVTNVTTLAQASAAPTFTMPGTHSTTVGTVFSLDLSTYITGSPAPAVTQTSGLGALNGSTFSYTPSSAGTYTFDFLASNSLGTASATLTLSVAAAPVTVPVLTLSAPTLTGFTAEWTACTGVSEYTLQVATNDSFAAGGTGEALLTESFDYISGTALVTLENGWTGVQTYGSTDGIRVGTSSSQGSVVSPALTDANGTLNVVYSSKYWSASDNTQVLLAMSLDGGTNYGTAQSVQLTADMTIYTNTFEGATAGAKIRWMGSAASNERFYLDDVTISSASSAGGLILSTNVSSTSCAVSNLDSYVQYFARVKGTGDWSAVQSITTTNASDAPPYFNALANQSVRAGDAVSFWVVARDTDGDAITLSASDLPDGATFATTSANGIVSNLFSFTPTASQAGQTFTPVFTATDVNGSATTRVSIVVSAGFASFSSSTLSFSEDGNPQSVAVTLDSNVGGTVNLAISGTALRGTDYTISSTSLVFAAGTTSQNVTLTPIDNSTSEGDRTIILTLVTNAAIGAGSIPTCTATLFDDDESPGTFSFSSTTYSVVEGAGAAAITLLRSGGAGGTVTVLCTTTAGTATPGSDYTTYSNTISFASGVTSRTFSVTILDDSATENIETVYLQIQSVSAGSIGSPSAATLSISDNDDPYASYYANAYNSDGSLKTGATLKAALHDIIDGHTSCTYDALWENLAVTDVCPTNSSQVLLLYLRIGRAASNHGGGSGQWNREHVWPDSHGIDAQRPAYTDMHHLHPTDVSVNGTRGNLDFDVVSGSANTYSYNSTSFEPPDSAKGDVARSVCYMAVRYNGDTSSEPDLEVIDSVGTSGDYLGKLSTLIEWNEVDPVDEFEAGRNTRVQSFQGNRNPFVDHPEWIRAVFAPETFVTTWTLTSAITGDGYVTPDSFNSVTDGDSKTFGITPSVYHYISRVLKDGVLIDQSLYTNSTYYAYTWSPVTNNGVLSVEFGEILAAHGTPQWWLAQYGYTTDFNAAELDDLNDDGVPNWQEYIDGTDPTELRLSVPAALWAAETNATDFTAAWSAVPNAETYWVDVMTTNLTEAVEGTVLLQESFETNIPASWSTNGVARISRNGGDGSYALEFGAVNESIITPVLDNASSISFIYQRSSSTAAWTLSVQVCTSTNGQWITVGSVADALATWQTNTTDLSAYAGQSIYVRLLDERASGTSGRYVDNIIVMQGGTSATTEYVPGYVARVVSNATSLVVTGLTAQTDYDFRVRAVASSATGLWSSVCRVMTIENVLAPQTITFAAIANQLTTNTVTLNATATSGLAVTYSVTGPATLSGTTLTFTGAGTVTVTASQAGNDNWTAATDVSRTFTVTKAAATVTLSGLSQTYDGTAKSASATTAPNGLTVNLTYDDSPTAPTAAGSYAVVATVSDSMYQGTASGTLVIHQASQTITFAAISDQMTTATVSLNATASSGLAVTYSVTGPATLSGTTLTFTGAGTVAVTASQSGNDNWTAAIDVSHTFTVTKATATVTLSGLSQTYDGTAKSASATTIPNGLTVNLTYDDSPTAPTAAGSYAVVATVADSMYQGTATGTLVIHQASQTITFEEIADQFATNTLTLSATAGSGLDVAYAVTGPATLSGNTLTFTGAGTVTVTASQAGNDNWTAATDVSRTFTVTKAAATVTLSGLSQTYDGTAKSASATTIPNGLTLNLTYEDSPTAPTNAGSYAISATVDDAMYQGTATGTLVIDLASQTITFEEIADQMATNTMTLSATANSGLDVAYAVTGPATLAGNTLTFTGAGTVTVTASQSGNGNWTAAADVSRTFTVTKAAATVTLSGLSQTYDGTAKSASATTIPNGLTLNLTYEDSLTAPTAAGSYAVVATVDDSMYQGTATGTLVINQASQTITFEEIADQFATNTLTLSATANSGLDVAYAVTGPATLAGNTLTFTGAGTVTVTASQSGNGNWTAAADVSHTFAVTKATATVTLGGLSHTYDGTAKSASATTVPADLETLTTYDGNAWAPTNAGVYAVTSSVVSDLYVGESSGILTVAQAAAQVTLGALQQNYDGTPKPVSVSTTPTGLTVRVTYDASETAPTATGTYTVLATVMDANYTGEASGSLTIGSGYAAVTLDNLSHTYDGTAHEVSVTTFPADLPVTVTYDGLATAPTNAGNYAVIATVTDSGYTGSAEGILVIAQASQTIDFAEIADQLTTNTLTLSASASSGLDISFTVTGPATINENVLTFTGAGTVTVTASQLGDTNWSAALDVSNTFIVARATAIVALSNLSQTFDGTAHIATATTTPADLDVVITYNGDTNPPVNAGSYAVNATIDDAMYSGSITGLLVVAQAPAVITLSNLEQTYDGTPREAGAAVEPAEAGVNITYDGTDVAPVSTGVYEVVATTTNANYSGTTNGTLVVGRGTATITLGALSQTFDGTARTVTVTTTPADLDVVITYNGDTNPPVNAGSYAVNATIDDAMYSGNATGTLVVAKANQTITFAEIADQLTTNTLTLSASASSGLDVSFTVTGPATINENVLTFTGAGTVTITASQPGDTNWNAAPDVVRSFAVTAAEIPLTDYEQWLESKDINPTNSAYAESDVLDADGDGVSNLDEYAADTDPSNADEVLAVTSALQSSGTWTLTPSPVSTNRFYSLVHATRLLGAEQTNELGRGAVGMSVTVTNMESDTWFGFIRVRMAE